MLRLTPVTELHQFLSDKKCHGQGNLEFSCDILLKESLVGRGHSVVFSAKRSQHTAVTPNLTESFFDKRYISISAVACRFRW